MISANSQYDTNTFEYFIQYINAIENKLWFNLFDI